MTGAPLSLALNNGKWTPETAPRGGRPPGSVNKTTQEVRELAQGLLESEEYRENLIARIMAGKAERLEALLWHYAYGKPKEILEVRPPEPEVSSEEMIEHLSRILSAVPVEQIFRFLGKEGVQEETKSATESS